MLQEKNIMRINQNIFLKIVSFFLFSIFLLVGLFSFRDYGLTIDEEFQRASGFYWLDYVLNFTNFESLKTSVDEIISKPRHFTLPPPEEYNQWGVIFDLPMALIETIFEIEDQKDYYHLRHFFNFILFFCSSIFFFKLLLNRFSNYKLSILGTLFYVLSPRIYGNSFYNNKDLIFLSLLTIALFFCFKLFEKINFKNLLLFSFFAAACTASRVLGIFLLFSFIGFHFLSISLDKVKINKFFPIIICCFFYSIFLIILWPYLWSSPIGNFISAFKFFSNHYLDIKMLYDGDYIKSTNLPYMYILKWIFITTPILYIFLFLFGYLKTISNFFKNIFNMESYNSSVNFWESESEKKDLFILFNLTIILFYLILFKTVLYNGWRHIYFLNVFIIYFSTLGLYNIGLYLNSKFKTNLHYFITIIFLVSVSFKMISYHPFQSLYFNNYLKNITHEKFEIDYWGLSGKKFLNDLIESNKDKASIFVGVASYLPLERSAYLLENKERKIINIVGQNYSEADYIYTNFIYEEGKYKDFKYKIPENFTLIYDFKIDGFKVYEVYKKN